VSATWSDPLVAWSNPLVTWDGQNVVVVDQDGVLTGNRVTAFRFDLLDSGEALLGVLGNVAGGELSWDAYASVKGVGTLEVSDLGDVEIDWLDTRIRPSILFTRAGGGSEVYEVQLGVFLCAAPVEQWTATGRRWTVELADKLSVLDQDIASGNPAGLTAYTAQAGANVIELVKALIAETGEASPAIEPDSATLPAPLVWEIGTTRLQIINDLLDVAGHFSLWCDGAGNYRATHYVHPSARVPVYEVLAPFTPGPTSLMSPEWTKDRDIYSVPNRYLVVGMGDGETEALTAVATNVDPASPYSYPARGRWITAVETGVEAADQAALDAIASRRLSDATSVTTSLEVEHAFLPDLLVNAVVTVVGVRASVNMTTVPLDPVELCSTRFRAVAS
jgi:hypothetical protein